LPSQELEVLYQELLEIIQTEKGDSKKAIAKTRPLLKEVIDRKLIHEKFLKPIASRPAAYLVYRPPDRSFSIVSMVWASGQRFPIHDHLSWGLIGVYQNAITEERFRRVDDGKKEGYAEIQQTGVSEFEEGKILEEGLLFDEFRREDIHRILNPTTRASVSIHILASDLGMKERHRYDPEERTVKRFVSGYDDPDGRLHGRIVAGTAESLINAEPQAILDTRGLVCPHPAHKTGEKLDGMGKGEVLEVLTDSEDSAYEEIPVKLRSSGVEFVALELPEGHWKIKARK
jgi:predicted metal-dependent enzyme (double-stranded beta helix superfamily)/TusA-related sulfurtransferase